MKSYSKDDYSLRRFQSKDWETYKSIRLEALQTNPEVFGSNYQKEAAYADQDWQDILQNDARAFFGLYYKDDLVGVTGAALNKEDHKVTHLVASFIRHDHRGKGLSSLFYQARLDWAQAKECLSVIVSHRVDNNASKAANQRFGFEYTHTQSNLWPDSVEADQVYYQLKL